MKSLQGQLLVASATLLDPNFLQTVVVMVQHDQEGALGLVLNRRTRTTLRKAWREVSEKPCNRAATLFCGGPCEGLLVSIHTQAQAADREILPGLFFTSEAKNLEWLVGQKKGTARFFVGYSGWTAGQLESELAEGAWLTIPAHFDDAFAGDDDQWLRTVNRIALANRHPAINPDILPGDIELN